MPDPEDIVEFSSVPGAMGRTTPTPRPAAGDGQAQGRAYLRIYFACANQYTRAYQAPTGDSYTARCPKCGLTKRFVVGSGGTSERFFQLTCR